ncbi:MAG: ThiF family adenylyltransferase [Micromonosporaceae bacterium]|nr:ThiF family adenylyltransferase [Micromonosporaceae bacterium]
MLLPPLVEPDAVLHADEIRRYARQLAIPGIGSVGQRRLKRARVLCVGAGGLGSCALPYLAAAGVGTIGIVEFDTVDESNLQRQIIHGSSDVGRLKIDSAREALCEINPWVEVITHPHALDSSNAVAIFSEYDLAIDGADNFATRYALNDAAIGLRKPYVWGSVRHFEGQAAVFWPGTGPCLRCLYPQPPAQGGPCGGVLGAVCATIGAIQVTEAVKLLTGVGESLVGSLVVYDALTLTHRKFSLARDPACPGCAQVA